MPLTFGFGSNMCYGRMKHRVPSLRFDGVGLIKGYGLVINKVSRDGSAKANIEPDAVETTYGVVFSLADDDVPALEEAEGVGEGYRVTFKLDVRTLDGGSWPEQVRTFVAQEGYTAADLWPYAWYKRHIVEGALHSGLPDDYVRRLQALPAAEDPDRQRDTRQRAFPCSRQLTTNEEGGLAALERRGGRLTDYNAKLRSLGAGQPSDLPHKEPPLPTTVAT